MPRTLAWLRARFARSGFLSLPVQVSYIFRRGGMQGLQQAYHYARSASLREQRYQAYLRTIEPALLATEAARPLCATAGHPRIGILVPLYNTAEWMLHRCIRSVISQTYGEWTLCLVDDGSTQPHVSKVAQLYADLDPRIRFERFPCNAGISAATNRALAIAESAGCEFVGLLDHDDELSQHALHAVALRLMSDPLLDFLYTDEDKIDDAPPVDAKAPVDPFTPPSHRHTASFKPGFSPHLLLSHNYMCHLLVVRTELAVAVGGFRSEYDGAQDYDLILRCISRIPPDRISHLPLILYHWRTHHGSTSLTRAAKPWALDAGRRALIDHLSHLGLSSHVTVKAHSFRPIFLLHFIPPRSHPEILILSTSATGAALESEVRAFANQHPSASHILVHHPVLRQLTAQEVRRFLSFALLPSPYTPDFIAPRLVTQGYPHRTLSAGFAHDLVTGKLEGSFGSPSAHDPGPAWRLLAPFNADAVSPLCVLIRTGVLKAAPDTAPLRCLILPDTCIPVPPKLHQLAGTTHIPFFLESRRSRCSGGQEVGNTLK